jgi:YD repeat-containing protein
MSTVRRSPAVALPAGQDLTDRSADDAPSDDVPLHKGRVEISNGVYIREDDDLIVSTTPRIVLRRTYLSGDRKSRRFGVGATHPGEWYLYGDGDPTIPWAELILADSGRIHFTRISKGSSQVGAVLRHDTTPTVFNGSLLSWDGNRWALRFRDGSGAWFLDCNTPKETCSVVEQRDPQGHGVLYVRDAEGTLQRIESAGRGISFEYDSQGRIIRARDTEDHSVAYSYDDAGRLVRSTSSDGSIRRYEYNERDEMVAIREQVRVVENWFDEAGRLTRQVVNEPEWPAPWVATLAYTLEGGSVVQTDSVDDGVKTVYRFNRSGYVVSETTDADGPSPITVTYDRDRTNTGTTITLVCAGPRGPVNRTVPLQSGAEEGAKDALIRKECRPDLR